MIFSNIRTNFFQFSVARKLILNGGDIRPIYYYLHHIKNFQGYICLPICLSTFSFQILCCNLRDHILGRDDIINNIEVNIIMVEVGLCWWTCNWNTN